MNNDCGGGECFETRVRATGKLNRGRFADERTNCENLPSRLTRDSKSAAALAGVASGPQSPIALQRLAAPEVVALTASREDLPTNAGDDFGFFIALGIAIPSGAFLWWFIAQAAKLVLAQ